MVLYIYNNVASFRQNSIGCLRGGNRPVAGISERKNSSVTKSLTNIPKLTHHQEAGCWTSVPNFSPPSISDTSSRNFTPRYFGRCVPLPCHYSPLSRLRRHRWQSQPTLRVALNWSTRRRCRCRLYRRPRTALAPPFSSRRRF